MNSQQFLTAMEIQTWQSRRTLIGAKKPVQFQTFQLISESENCFGYLLLDTSPNLMADQKNVAQLLEAMLQAIGLKHLPIKLTKEIFTESSKILIMGQTLAEILLNSKEENEITLSSNIVITFHPAELLIQKQLKRQAWMDLQRFAK